MSSRELLGAGADPNARQRHGYTPLHAAAENGNEAMVERLLDAGADPAAATDDGRTPADLARAGGHDKLASRLAR
ncbi:MAG TPA: ankyrin repeat domain-containing protein [Candidatus Limnocylindrales bacterium]